MRQSWSGPTFDQQPSLPDILVMSGSRFVCHDLRHDYPQIISRSCRENNRVPPLLIWSPLTSRQNAERHGGILQGLGRLRMEDV